MKKRTIAQTPAPSKDIIKGSCINKVGSARKENSSSIILSDTTIKILQDKLNEFKKKHPNNKSITLNDLKAVYRRGSGAYSTSHRPNITRAGWSYARVNKFLEKAGGNKVKEAYVQDDDLLKFEQGGKLKTYWYKGLFKSNYFEKLDNYKEGGNIDKEYNDYVKRVYDLAKFNANLPKGYGLTLSDESRENYNKKNKEIEKLVKIALENNYEVYYNEKQKVIYFIIDNIQISFHTRGNSFGLPHTNIFWDGVKNSYKYKKNKYDALKQKRLDIILPKIDLLEKKEKEFIEKGKKQLEIWEKEFDKIPEKEKQAIYKNDTRGFSYDDKKKFRQIESLKSTLKEYNKKDPYNNKRPKLGFISLPFSWRHKYDKKDIDDWNTLYNNLGDIAHELNKMYKKGYHTPEIFTVG